MAETLRDLRGHPFFTSVSGGADELQLDLTTSIRSMVVALVFPSLGRPRTGGIPVPTTSDGEDSDPSTGRWGLRGPPHLYASENVPLDKFLLRSVQLRNI
ncbi:hypothetical protein FRB90_006977 [Tulasnella sp. 427]|nr:hypothetical protein FRB90_006977 [Tulasnella sp. 427]